MQRDEEARVNLSRNDRSGLMANPRQREPRVRMNYGILVQNSRSVEHEKKKRKEKNRRKVARE